MAPPVVPKMPLNSGHSLPQLGLGTWQSKVGEVGEAVKISLQEGYRHLDCAMGYANHDEIGNVLSEAFKSGQVKREDVFITSKIWNTFHSYGKARAAIDTMLKDLQLTYLDLCLIHWPMGYNEEDGFMPKDENGKMIYADTDYLDTWKAMEEAVKAGKVRSIGLSNFNTKQIDRVISKCTIKPAVLQVEVHPYLQQTPLLEYCKKNGIVMTAFSPLANNTHMFRQEGQPNLLEDKVISNIAQKHKKTPAQVALRWAIQRGTVAIPKSTRQQRLQENIDVFDFQLTAEDMEAIKGLDRNFRLLTLERDISHPHYPFHQKS